MSQPTLFEGEPSPATAICRVCGSVMREKGGRAWWCADDPDHYFGRLREGGGLWLYGEPLVIETVPEADLPLWAQPLSVLQPLQNAWVAERERWMGRGIETNEMTPTNEARMRR